MKPVYHDNIPNEQEKATVKVPNCAALQLQGRCLHMEENIINANFLILLNDPNIIQKAEI